MDAKIYAKDIGKRIAQRRNQLGLTQEQAAEKSVLSPQFFSCVESGIKNIRAENIIRVSQTMDVSTDYILLGKSNGLDHNYLVELLEPLNEVQLKCMEEIIKNYLIACGYMDSPYQI